MLDSPVMDQAFRAQQTPDGREEPWKVDIKRRGAISTVTSPYNPLDAVGWKGDLTPVKINVEPFRPRTRHRYPPPPSAHPTSVPRRPVAPTLRPRTRPAH